MHDNPWEEFYKITENQPPSPLLVKALKFVINKDTALDLGAGALKDTKLLLHSGFKKVIAVDDEPLFLEIAQKIKDDRVTVFKASFNEFEYQTETYDLVNAQLALPFNHPDSFNSMWSKVKDSIKKEGIFTGHFFGINDEWNIQDQKMTFHKSEEVQELLLGMDLIECNEVEEDSTLVNGAAKHWHIFHVIARKNS